MDYVKESKLVFKMVRPKNFLDNPDHCEECREVEEKAQRNDLDTLTLQEAGEGYAALHNFLNDEGFLYYFPAFIRLAVESRKDEGYIENLLFAITYKANENRILKACDSKQIAFVFSFLRWYQKNNGEKMQEWFLTEDIENAIKIWSF